MLQLDSPLYMKMRMAYLIQLLEQVLCSRIQPEVRILLSGVKHYIQTRLDFTIRQWDFRHFKVTQKAGIQPSEQSLSLKIQRVTITQRTATIRFMKTLQGITTSR